MKMQPFASCLLVLALGTISLVDGLPGEELRNFIWKNSKGEKVFGVLTWDNLNIVNPHRGNPVHNPFELKLYFGDMFSQVHQIGDNHWSFPIVGNISTVELNMVERSPHLTEYRLVWHFTANHFDRQNVCFYLGIPPGNAHWYNAYQSQNPSWPMNPQKQTPDQRFNFAFDYNRYDGLQTDHKEEAIGIQEHLYINSDGFALLLDRYQKLYVQRTSGAYTKICFHTGQGKPYTFDPDLSYLDLEMHIFASRDIRSVLDYVVHESGYIPKPVQIPDERLFRDPIWFTDVEYGNVADKQGPLISALEHQLSVRNLSGLIMTHYWHADKVYDLSLPSAYPESSLISQLQSTGFRVGMQFLRPRPHLLSPEQVLQGNKYVDFSRDDAALVFQGQFSLLQRVKNIDAFHFTAHSHEPLDASQMSADTLARHYPNEFTAKYIETFSRLNATTISEFAFKSQHLPGWNRLTNYELTPDGQLLHDLIPNVLSVSIAGYSWLVPYSVGGFCRRHLYDRMPSPELYIRMVQAVTLMPGLSFTLLPWSFSNVNSAQTERAVLKAIALHKEYAELMIELAKKRIETGEPIIRPMWYTAPDDPHAYPIADQFMLGPDIVVAPVLNVGQYSRPVYLPPGTWLDQHGESHMGPQKFSVAAPLEELTYFKRKNE